MAFLISTKIDFKLKPVRRDGEGQFILITGTINQEEVSILNIYDPNIRVPTYVKETVLELKSHIKPHTLIVGDFNTPLLPKIRSIRQIFSLSIHLLNDLISSIVWMCNCLIGDVATHPEVIQVGYTNFFFSFWRNLHTDSHSDCTSFILPLTERILLYPQPHENLSMEFLHYGHSRCDEKELQSSFNLPFSDGYVCWTLIRYLFTTVFF